jgi:peroxiredoxin
MSISKGDKIPAASFTHMVADGSAAFTRAIGLDLDLTERGMGVRSQRYAMIVDNGTVTDIAVESAGKFEVSSAEAILGKL